MSPARYSFSFLNSWYEEKIQQVTIINTSEDKEDDLLFFWLHLILDEGLKSYEKPGILDDSRILTLI